MNDMKVALFIPCYIDALYPKVGIATLELLERLGVEVEYPLEQTCCGQPMANEGDQKHSKKTEENFCKNFAGYDTIVCPGGSCVKHVRLHLDAIEQTDEVRKIRENTYELTEFLHDVLDVQDFPWAEFPHKVAIHNSCSSIRGLHMTSLSEWVMPPFNKTKDLLDKVKGINIETLDRPDECCGFGGTFCATDPYVAAKMGSDRLEDYMRQEIDYVVSPDSSCMMHQSGIALKKNLPLQFVHLAQVLNNGPF